MDALTVTVNEDGTLTFTPPVADPVLCPTELWAELVANDHVVLDVRPPVDQWDTGLTTISLTCTTIWLQYRVKTQNDTGYVLELAGYSEM